MAYFMATTEGISAENFTRLFRNNVWKLYKLSENIISDKRLQFAAKMIKNWIAY